MHGAKAMQGEAMQAAASSGDFRMFQGFSFGIEPPVIRDTQKMGKTLRRWESFLSPGGSVALSGSSGTPKSHSLGLAKVHGKLGN